MGRIKFIVVVLCVLLFGVIAVSAQDDVEAIWERANTKYSNADYRGAIIAYDSIVNEGSVSEELFFNLANAYFKEDRIGKAIVNYNKALKLNPWDEDISYNLAYANSFIKDRIEVVPEFFLKKWFRSVRSIMSSNGWAVASLLFLGLTLGFLLLYLLFEKISVRKTGFWLSIILFLMFIFAVSFAIIERREILDASHAIVLNSAAPIKSSPDRTSKDIFILHEGTKVKILSHFGEWTEIQIADGNKGWIVGNSLELID